MSLATGLSYTGYNGALTQVNGGGNGLSGSLIYGKNPLATRLARELKGLKNKSYRSIMRALVQGGASQAITEGTWVRRQAATGMSAQGGQIVMETATAVGASGNTAAADVTEVTAAVFDDSFTVASFPRDTSGNGGGGKGKF